jgi:hypothetical protein
MRKLIVSLAALLCCFAAFAVAQDETQTEGKPVPRFVTLPPTPSTQSEEPAVTLPTWTGSFKYEGTKYTYYMVGTAPAKGTSTTVNAFIIPVKIVIGSNTFDPTTTDEDGQTVVALTEESPIFQTQTYTLGGVDVGDTQYEDAFQRANFWGKVKKHTGYHVLLGGPTVLSELTLNPGSNGAVLSSNPFGGSVPTALVNINYVDAQIQAYIKANSEITPDTIPIFMTVNTYLTDGSPILNNCCIGGYHSANGPQAYSQFTFIPIPGDFSQDVSALSHELGEWMDDPGVKGAFNSVKCGILEVGDPEEGFTNYGGFPYPLGGFTYNLQDLVFLEYFGAPDKTSVNGWETFHDNPFGLGICNNGG